MLKSKMFLLGAILISMMSASCNSSQNVVLSKVELPAAPSNFGKPIELPRPVVGMNSKLFALQNRKALLEANRRLINDSEFYADVKRDFTR